MRRWIILGACALACAVTVFVIAAVLLFRDNVDAMMTRARQLRDSGRLDEAADLFGQISLLHPMSSRAHEALFERGDTFYVYGIPNASNDEKIVMRSMAEEAYRQLIERYPGSEYVEEARLNLGEIYTEIAMEARERGEDGEAIEKSALALEQYEFVVDRIYDPVRKQEALFAMSECHDCRGEYNDAARRCREVIELGLLDKGRCFEKAHLTLVNYFDRAGNYEMAVIQLREMLSYPVNHITKQMAFARMAKYLLDLNRFDEADAALDEVTPNDSNRDQILLLRESIDSRRASGAN